MQCGHCGFYNDENTKFCWRCGQELAASDSAPQKPSKKSASSKKKSTINTATNEPEPYFTTSQQWIFLGAMTVMLVAMTIFGFVGAK